MSLRTERIAQQLCNEMARLLGDTVTDPRVRNVTLLRVDVSPDLSNAIVYWSFFDPMSKNDDQEQMLDAMDEAQDGLESAAGFIRRRLAHKLELRRMPELRFRYDPSLQVGGETLELLRTIDHGKEPKQE